MLNDNFYNVLSKLAEALSGSSKNKQKSGNKPENSAKTSGGKPSYGGDFTTKDTYTVSPKQSVMEMLRRHEEISKKIDRNTKDE